MSYGGPEGSLPLKEVNRILHTAHYTNKKMLMQIKKVAANKKRLMEIKKVDHIFYLRQLFLFAATFS